MRLRSWISLSLMTLIALHSMCDVPITESIVLPQKVMWTSGSVSDSENLLEPFSGQVAVSDTRFTVMRSLNADTASILLDFGKEYHGALKIFAGIRSSKKAARLRITLGESVTEAMSRIDRDTEKNPTNDHAVREMVVEVPWLGAVNTGNSGFRFARLDLLDTDIDFKLKAIQLVARERHYDYLGTFSCSDPVLNDIWQTSARTVQLNMQEYIWDGIKRDRLVWLGDLNPEILVACNVFGGQSWELIHRSLDFGCDAYPLPKFINDMSSYSLWWIINQHDLYLYEGNKDYLSKQLPYLRGLVNLFSTLIDHETGEERIPGGFLDWPTSQMPEVIHAGMQSLALIAMDNAERIAGWLGDKDLAKQSADLASILRRHHPNCLDNTQALSLNILSGLTTDAKTDAGIILQNGLEQYSTFFGYYTSEALAAGGHTTEALRNIKDYWGGMLALGATSFWEDFSFADAQGCGRIDGFVPEGMRDIHSQGGDYCYKGLRLSMCHGWAGGPAAWLIGHILGVSPAEPGCKTVYFEPNLGDLDHAEGSFPTPHGIIKVKLTKRPDGTVNKKITLPKGVKIVKR